MWTYLKVLATDQARIYVDWTQGYHTALLKVEVQVLHGQEFTKIA